ncbi:MAG: ankyrin repeat domain-containing protein, partial [Pseudomonadota bacterium]|nr:ankyrin repeat domain-containing protein [Pseudomonadota bacterium]
QTQPQQVLQQTSQQQASSEKGVKTVAANQKSVEELKKKFEKTGFVITDSYTNKNGKKIEKTVKLNFEGTKNLTPKDKFFKMKDKFYSLQWDSKKTRHKEIISRIKQNFNNDVIYKIFGRFIFTGIRKFNENNKNKPNFIKKIPNSYETFMSDVRDIVNKKEVQGYKESMDEILNKIIISFLILGEMEITPKSLNDLKGNFVMSNNKLKEHFQNMIGEIVTKLSSTGTAVKKKPQQVQAPLKKVGKTVAANQVKTTIKPMLEDVKKNYLGDVVNLFNETTGPLKDVFKELKKSEIDVDNANDIEEGFRYLAEAVWGGHTRSVKELVGSLIQLINLKQTMYVPFPPYDNYKNPHFVNPTFVDAFDKVAKLIAKSNSPTYIKQSLYSLRNKTNDIMVEVYDFFNENTTGPLEEVFKELQKPDIDVNNVIDDDDDDDDDNSIKINNVIDILIGFDYLIWAVNEKKASPIGILIQNLRNLVNFSDRHYDKLQGSPKFLYAFGEVCQSIAKLNSINKINEHLDWLSHSKHKEIVDIVNVDWFDEIGPLKEVLTELKKPNLGNAIDIYIGFEYLVLAVKNKINPGDKVLSTNTVDMIKSAIGNKTFFKEFDNVAKMIATNNTAKQPPAFVPRVNAPEFVPRVNASAFVPKLPNINEGQPQKEKAETNPLLKKQDRNKISNKRSTFDLQDAKYIIKAIKNNDDKGLKSYINQDNVNNILNPENVAPIMYAIGYESLDMVRTLIELGADVNIKDGNYGNTPLIAAIIKDQPRPKMVRMLIENSADINLADNRGNTPFNLIMNDKNPKQELFYIIN